MPTDNEDDYSAQQHRRERTPPKEMGERMARQELITNILEGEQEKLRRDAGRVANKLQDVENAVRDFRGDMERMAKVSTENGMKLDKIGDLTRWFEDNKDALDIFVRYRRTAPSLVSAVIKIGAFVISVGVFLFGAWQWFTSHWVMK